MLRLLGALLVASVCCEASAQGVYTPYSAYGYGYGYNYSRPIYGPARYAARRQAFGYYNYNGLAAAQQWQRTQAMQTMANAQLDMARSLQSIDRHQRTQAAIDDIRAAGERRRRLEGLD